MSRWVKVCDEQTGICKLVLEANAPVNNPDCELRMIHVLDEETQQPIEEQAYVCNIAASTQTAEL